MTRLRVAVADAATGARTRLVIYDWFVFGEHRPPPRPNHRVEVLIDGEQTWSRVAEDLERASGEIRIATWMARPNIELLRPVGLALRRPSRRAHLRLGALLERRASAGVAVRLLIWGLVSTPILDRWLRRWVWRPIPAIDVLEQDHPHLLGSLHQKVFIIDDRVGYCGGMNLMQRDWDTTAHAIFDPRRHPFSSGVLRRQLVARRLLRPWYPPRHDLMVRFEGPAVADLLDDFADRWAQSVKARERSRLAQLVDGIRRLLGNDGYPNVPRATAMPEPRGKLGLQWVQVVRTTPGGEDGILGAYVRAIRNARRYIYIENQYFRSPLIGQELQAALRHNPLLRLAVVVHPVNDGKRSLFSPSGYWTAHTLELIRKARPDFALTRLIVWDRDALRRLVFEGVYVHAKIMIVDDVWLTVGSANINDRGFLTEGELNVIVLDKPIAGELRKRLMAEHLELDVGDRRLDDIDEAFDLWEHHARENPRLRERGQQPISRVHRFVQRGARRPPFGVGSGIF